MLSRHKKDLNPLIEIVSKPFLKLNPNLLTIFGLIFPILFFIFLQNGNYIWALVFLIGSAFDSVDGAVARKTGKVTRFGGVLDSTLDRLSDAIYISAFGFASLVGWSLTIALIIASFLISYIRSRAELAGKAKFKLDIGLIERSERIILLGVATISLIFAKNILYFGFSLVELIFILILLLSSFTVLQRLQTAYNKLK